MNDNILFKSESETVSFQGKELEMPNTRLEDRAEWAGRFQCVEGRLHGITAMVEHDADCQRILEQIAAVQVALHEVTGLLVKHYLHPCLEECLQNPNANVREHCLADVISLYQLMGGS